MNRRRSGLAKIKPPAMEPKRRMTTIATTAGFRCVSTGVSAASSTCGARAPRIARVAKTMTGMRDGRRSREFRGRATYEAADDSMARSVDANMRSVSLANRINVSTRPQRSAHLHP
jgi:hypothetical protein